MHGDEPVGRQVILQLALQLCEDNKNADVIRILSTMHVIAVISANPDGFAAHSRTNLCAQYVVIIVSSPHLALYRTPQHVNVCENFG